MAVTDPITVTEVAPASVRDEVIDLLWEHRHWPKSSRSDYERLWDWRYTSLSDGEAWVWVAREPLTGKLIGHVACYRRTWRLDSAIIHGVVPGDVLVHPDWRRRGVGMWLLAIPRKQLVEGRVELVVVTGNELTYRLNVRLGQRELGTFYELADLRRAGSALSRRIRGGALLGPVVDCLLAVRRWFRQRRLREIAQALEVVPLQPYDRLMLDRSHWQYDPNRLVSHDSEQYILRRFLQDPFQERMLYQIRARSGGELEGYVIVDIRGQRASVCACSVNAGRLTEAMAIALVASRLSREIEVYSVSTQPGSLLSSDLRRLGFLDRGVGASDRTLHVTAHWLDSHPCARPLERVENWSVYTGWSDS